MKQASSRGERQETGSVSAIAKVCAVFRGLTSSAPLRLSEMADAAGLNCVTTLRILDALIAEGFVVRHGSPPRYLLGPEIAAMVGASSRSIDLVGIVRPGLVRLAAETEDTALLSVRVNNELVCLDKQVGTYPIRANFLDVGSRRPLGVGGGSMSLLAWLPDPEIDAILQAVSPRLAAYPRLTVDVLRTHILEARAAGYVLMVDVVVEKMGAVDVPIFDGAGKVVTALSVPALKERIIDREKEMAAAMLREAARITRLLADRGSTTSPGPRVKRRGRGRPIQTARRGSYQSIRGHDRWPVGQRIRNCPLHVDSSRPIRINSNRSQPRANGSDRPESCPSADWLGPAFSAQSR